MHSSPFPPQAAKFYSLKPVFEQHGYTLYYHTYTGAYASPWLRTAGPYWYIDMYNRSRMDSVDLLLAGRPTTKVRARK